MDSAVEARLRLCPGLFMVLNTKYLIMLTSLALNSGIRQQAPFLAESSLLAHKEIFCVLII